MRISPQKCIFMAFSITGQKIFMHFTRNNHQAPPPHIINCVYAHVVGYESLNSGQARAYACKRSLIRFSLNWFGMCKRDFRESIVTCMTSWPDYFNNGIVWHYIFPETRVQITAVNSYSVIGNLALA